MKAIYIFLVSACIAVILLACDSSSEPVKCQSKKCTDYQTQVQAQTAFDADKTCLKNLDTDGDGTACEELANGGGNTNCPTTSNCGCSNKNKDQCESSCCKWVKGTGCVCR